MPAAPRSRLDSGPATAIRPSALGEGASLLRRAIPPRSHSSIPSVWTPKRRAHEGVGELVEEDRPEEGDDADRGRRPVGGRAGAGRAGREGAGGQADAEEPRDDGERPVDRDGDPGDLPEAEESADGVGVLLSVHVAEGPGRTTVPSGLLGARPVRPFRRSSRLCRGPGTGPWPVTPSLGCRSMARYDTVSFLSDYGLADEFVGRGQGGDPRPRTARRGHRPDPRDPAPRHPGRLAGAGSLHPVRPGRRRAGRGGSRGRHGAAGAGRRDRRRRRCRGGPGQRPHRAGGRHGRRAGSGGRPHQHRVPPRRARSHLRRAGRLRPRGRAAVQRRPAGRAG